MANEAAERLKKWCEDKSAAESLGVAKELREGMVVALEVGIEEAAKAVTGCSLKRIRAIIVGLKEDK